MDSQYPWEPSGNSIVMPIISQGLRQLPAAFGSAAPFPDAPGDLTEMGALSGVNVDGTDLLTVPSSFARDLGDLQEAGRAEDWPDSLLLRPSHPTGPAVAMNCPSLDWESSLNNAGCFLDENWANPDIKRRRSAPASQKASESHFSTASHALIPDWPPELHNGNTDEYQPGGSLPKHGNQRQMQRHTQQKNRGGRQPRLRRDHSYPASFPASAMYQGSRLDLHRIVIPKQDLGCGMKGEDLSRLERRAASRKLVYRIRSNALTSKEPARVFGFEMMPPAKAKPDPKTSSSNAFSEEHRQINSSPEISSEQGQVNNTPSMPTGAPIPNEGKSGPRQVAVDACKLTQFLAQIQTIQEKMTSLQLERQASQKRMETIEESAVKMSCLLRDLEHLKANGAPVGDREERLEHGSQELQSLLQALRQKAEQIAVAR